MIIWKKRKEGGDTVEKVLVAMSGGVDSSVASYLMLQAGYDCAGATMLLHSTEQTSNLTDCRAIASRLGIPFHVLDCTQAFQDAVIAPFIGTYEEGGTPNPCIQCNRHLKFGLLLEKARAMGFDAIATGHYAKIEKDPVSGRYLLYRSADKSKDQTYFLYSLTQEQLARTHFPLGRFSKAEVRQIAQEQGFLNAKKQDSQDICFIPDGDYFSFMKRYTGKDYPQGAFLDLAGNVVGRHSGAVAYTIGQRKGLGIAMGEPVYVCCKDMENNTVSVGPDAALYRSALRANDWNWIAYPAPSSPIRATAKVRYRHTEQPATVYPEDGGFAQVEFDTPQRAITTGQAVVLYDGDLVIGGGTITQVL